MSSRRQGISFLVAVAFSAQLFIRLTISADRTTLALSNVVHARAPPIAAAATLPPTSRTFIAFQPSLSSPPQTRRTARNSSHVRLKSPLSDVLMVCNELNPEDLRTSTRVPGWEYPLQKSFVRAITPDKSTTSRLSTLVGDLFGPVSQPLKGGAGSEVFTPLLRWLSRPRLR